MLASRVNRLIPTSALFKAFSPARTSASCFFCISTLAWSDERVACSASNFGSVSGTSFRFFFNACTLAAEEANATSVRSFSCSNAPMRPEITRCRSPIEKIPVSFFKFRSSLSDCTSSSFKWADCWTKNWCEPTV